MTTQDYPDNTAFVAELCGLLTDRGLIANLRKWWSPTTRHYAYPILGRLRALKDERMNGKILCAAAFAVHALGGKSPHVANQTSLGTAVLALAGGSPKAAGFDSMEHHFRRLLAAESLDDLKPQLHRLVKRLGNEGISLDYARLLSDLRQFENYTERIKTEWAKDFWQANEPATSATPQA